MRGGKKPAVKRTTISLPYHLWEELRIESIRTGTPMGELIAQKLSQLKRLREKTFLLEADEQGFLKSPE